MALAFQMWGHRKIAWLCRRDGLAVSDATCLRVLRDSGLVLPGRLRARAPRPGQGTPRRVRHDPHGAATVSWQTDFFELETSGGGTWRSGDVIDYATKLVLAGPVTATQSTRDAISAIEDARAQVYELLGYSRSTTSPARAQARSRR